jgi:hypothetical protein
MGIGFLHQKYPSSTLPTELATKNKEPPARFQPAGIAGTIGPAKINGLGNAHLASGLPNVHIVNG